ncbi:hypothetical protein BCR44DRAFT_1427010 [Catenaria anguillulae PL171]|uniref:Nucleotide-diphospho-sugar transferase domain-containing protein n=1 Tax=Catenaria anguillulae PL171 TaxID=765915 RepID=A0A1Y2HWN4_9FUNG|nr:hypothetical protein BCR44DRAFT_1427010 [Catenaria anguillulae PL171]
MSSSPSALGATGGHGPVSPLYPLPPPPNSTHANRRSGVAAVFLGVSLVMTHHVLSFNVPPVALALVQAIVLFFVTAVPANDQDQGLAKNSIAVDQQVYSGSNSGGVIAGPWMLALAMAAALALTNVALAVSPSALIVQVVLVASETLLARCLLSEPTGQVSTDASRPRAPVVLPLIFTCAGTTIFLLGSFGFGSIAASTGSGEWIVPVTASIFAAVARIAAHVLIVDPARATSHSSAPVIVNSILPRVMAVLAVTIAFVEFPILLHLTQISATLGSAESSLDFPWTSLGAALITACIANRIHPSYSQESPPGPALVAGFFGTGTGVTVRTGMGPRVELVAALVIAGMIGASASGPSMGVLTSQWWGQALGVLMMVAGMRAVHAVDAVWRIRYQSLPHTSTSVAGHLSSPKLESSPDGHFTTRRRRPAMLLLFTALALVSLAVLALMTATGSDPSSPALGLLLHHGKGATTGDDSTRASPSPSASHDKHTIQDSDGNLVGEALPKPHPKSDSGATKSDKPARARTKPAQKSVANLMHDLWAASTDPTRLVWDWRKASPGGASLASLPGPARTPRVLVMHADNRPLKSLASVGNDPFALDHLTIGPLYTLSWALRFGYDYRRLSLTGSRLAKPYQIGGWYKPKIIYDALHRYEYVVFFDSDAYVAKPDMSLAEMLKRWGFHDTATMMMALDPPGQKENNWNATNTGFWVLRSTPRAKEIMRDLATCPDRPDCRKWLTEWPAEQAAFTKLIRPKLVEGQDLIIAPCEEANGWWGFPGPCKGTIITHAWTGKEQVARDMLMRLLTQHVILLERLLMNGYHSMDSCTPWVTGKDERCRFIEDVDIGDPVAVADDEAEADDVDEEPAASVDSLQAGDSVSPDSPIANGPDAQGRQRSDDETVPESSSTGEMRRAGRMRPIGAGAKVASDAKLGDSNPEVVDSGASRLGKSANGDPVGHGTGARPDPADAIKPKDDGQGASKMAAPEQVQGGRRQGAGENAQMAPVAPGSAPKDEKSVAAKEQQLPKGAAKGVKQILGPLDSQPGSASGSKIGSDITSDSLADGLGGGSRRNGQAKADSDLPEDGLGHDSHTADRLTGVVNVNGDAVGHRVSDDGTKSDAGKSSQMKRVDERREEPDTGSDPRARLADNHAAAAPLPDPV